jgi:energy-coupling factor transport system permease protein
MKFDPRTKIITASIISASCVFMPDIIYMAALILASLLFCVLFKARLIMVLVRARALLITALIVAVLQSLSASGANLITKNGVIFGAEFLGRMIVIILSSSIILTSNSREITDALIKMKFPYELCFALSVTLRFLPMLKDEISNRIRAIALRGVNLKRLNPLKKITAYTYVLSPSLAGVIIKSRALAHSMTARAFRAYNTRTMLRELKFTPWDFVVIIMLLALIAGFIALYITKGRFL